MMDIGRALGELGRRALIYDRLGVYAQRGKAPSPEALVRLLSAPTARELYGPFWELRDLEPMIGEVIFVRSGDGGESEVTYGSERCDELERVYGDRMHWRPAGGEPVEDSDK